MPNPANELSVAVSEGAVTVGQHTFRLSGADARRRISTVRDLLAFLEQQVAFADKRLTPYTSRRDIIVDLEDLSTSVAYVRTTPRVEAPPPPMHGADAAALGARSSPPPLSRQSITSALPIGRGAALAEDHSSEAPALTKPTTSSHTSKLRVATGPRAVKCVVLGEAQAGKTCLLTKLAKHRFQREYVPTVFDNFSVTTTVEDEVLRLELYDSAGQADYDRLRPLSYPRTEVFVLCFSVVEPELLDKLHTRWLPEIAQHGPDVPIVLVGLKTDLRADAATLARLAQAGLAPVTHAQGEALAKDLGAKLYLEASALTGEGVQTAMDEAARIAVGVPTQTPTRRSGRGSKIGASPSKKKVSPSAVRAPCEAVAVKCAVVGDGAVGKTCLLTSFISNSSPGEYIPTELATLTASITVDDDQRVDFTFADTGGHEETAEARCPAYADAQLVLLCFSVLSHKSLGSLRLRWLNEIEANAPGVPLVVMGLKTDLRDEVNEPVLTKEGAKFAAQIGAQLYAECSALTQEGLRAAFDELARVALGLPVRVHVPHTDASAGVSCVDEGVASSSDERPPKHRPAIAALSRRILTLPPTPDDGIGSPTPASSQAEHSEDTEPASRGSAPAHPHPLLAAAVHRHRLASAPSLPGLSQHKPE